MEETIEERLSRMSSQPAVSQTTTPGPRSPRGKFIDVVAPWISAVSDLSAVIVYFLSLHAELPAGLSNLVHVLAAIGVCAGALWLLYPDPSGTRSWGRLLLSMVVIFVGGVLLADPIVSSFEPGLRVVRATWDGPVLVDRGATLEVTLSGALPSGEVPWILIHVDGDPENKYYVPSENCASNNSGYTCDRLVFGEARHYHVELRLLNSAESRDLVRDVVAFTDCAGHQPGCIQQANIIQEAIGQPVRNGVLPVSVTAH